MPTHRTTTAKQRRRDLRQAATKPEQLVWALVRNRRLDGFKFRRQHSIGRCVVDFACLEIRLVLEIDGDYHDHTIEQDLDRQQFLEDEGYTASRFSNEDVLGDLEAVRTAISNIAVSLLPSSALRAPSPPGGAGTTAEDIDV